MLKILFLHLYFHPTATVAPTPPLDESDPDAEFKQDFRDFDLNNDKKIDPQEIRAQFKGDLSLEELFSFIDDVDKNQDGVVHLQEYVDYASSL